MRWQPFHTAKEDLQHFRRERAHLLDVAGKQGLHHQTLYGADEQRSRSLGIRVGAA